MLVLRYITLFNTRSPVKGVLESGRGSRCGIQGVKRVLYRCLGVSKGISEAHGVSRTGRIIDAFWKRSGPGSAIKQKNTVFMN